MELPQAIEAAKERLENERGHKVHIVLIKGQYYAYEEEARSVNGTKKVFTLYLGKIKPNSTFVQARHRKKAYGNVQNVEELVAKQLSQAQQSNPIDELANPDDIDLSILEAISTDARISINSVAKALGISVAMARYRLERLEKRYNIKYTIEIATMPLGYLRYIVLIKFIEGMPKIEEIRNVLQAEPTIQLVALLKGEYDLLIYMFAENTKTLEDKLYGLRSSRVFAPFKSYWYVSYITYAYGFIPLRSEFFEELKNRVWRRTKETPRKPQTALTEREYLVLKSLNENSREEFAKIDKKLGFDIGATQYTFYKLLQNRIILRATITMRRLPIKYNIVLTCPQTNTLTFNAHRKEFLVHLISLPNTPASRYALEGDIGIPRGVLLVTPSYSENIEDIEKTLAKYLKGAEIKSSIITQMLVGELGYRRLAETATEQYQIIRELQ